MSSDKDNNSKSGDNGIFDHASMEVNQVGNQIDGFKDNQKAIDNNKNATDTQKSIATGLNYVEGGIQAFGVLTSLSTKLSESLMMPIMEKLAAFKGQAILPVCSQMNPVFGIDVHMVTIPPSPAPVPMPHPYIGMMFRTLDFVSCAALSLIPTPEEAPPITEESDEAAVDKANIQKAKNIGHTVATMAVSMLGASVMVGKFPRVVAGTPSKQIPHFPMGAGFHPVYSRMVKKDVGHALLGSLFVVADGSPLTGTVPHMHNDCWDVGVFSIHNVKPNRNADKKPVFPAHLYVPSGLITPIPSGKPVITNMIPAPINPLTIGSRLFKAGLGKLRRFNQKKIDKMAGKSNLGCKFWTGVSKLLGTGTSHPADVASGNFYTDNVDFSLSGIIPIDWERTYYSYSEYAGPLGVGWHHPYDMALDVMEDTGVVALRMEDGRLAAFLLPEKGASEFNRKEKLWLYRTLEDTYYVTDLNGLIYNFTSKKYLNPFNKAEAYLLQSISNTNGYSIRLEYDYDGVLCKMTDTTGRIIKMETDGKGHISAIRLPSPNKLEEDFVVSKYGYDDQGRLISQTDALENTMYFEYKGTLMVKEVWRNKTTWDIKYDGAGNDAKCLEIRGTGGLFHHKLHYVSPNCTEVENSLGQKTIYYHQNGLVTKRVEPNGGEYVFRYNQYNELEWEIDPLGNMKGQLQDELGNLCAITAADGGRTELQYEDLRFPYLPTSAMDAAGGRWAWEYDAQGNLCKRVDPMKAVTLFEYKDGLLTTITGALGQKTKLYYDVQGNLTETVSPDGGRNSWKYDKLGQCTRYENAQQGVTEYEYNLLGDIVKVKEPDGNIRELQYDAEGNVVVAKDKERFVTFSYRGVNKLASRTEKGATLRFIYDTEDQLRGVENENGEQYSFRLDAQGDVVEETGFDGLKRIYRRDLAGQVTSVKRPSGKEVAYEYDPVGRVTKVIYNPEEKDIEEETYEYRQDGALIKAVNKDAEVVLQRDVLGRVIKEMVNGNEVSSQYDLAGNRPCITSSLGADIQAEYNLMGDLVSLASGGWQSQYERDLFGLETGRTLSGGLQTCTTRDRMGRVTGHKTDKNNRSLSEKSYTWGINDKLMTISSDGKETHFEYDQWGNLSRTLFADGKVEHRNPDKSGNLFERLDRLDRKYSKGGQLLRTERWEYKYDNEGNLIRKKGKDGQTWRYHWNEAGMLAKVTRPDAAEVSFKYDALGRRIEKKIHNHITRWVWDGNVPLNEWKETYTKDYSTEKGYFYNIEKSPVITWVFEDDTFVPTAKLTERNKFSIVTNYLGTPEAMYSDEGENIWSCELNSYGKVRNFRGTFKSECPFRYQGQYEDAETGLYYNRFRYYSPEEGIYISQDPIGLNGGYELYSYVKNPNLWIDIVGLSSEVFTDSNGTTLDVSGYTNIDHMDVDELKGVYYSNKNSTYGGRSPRDKEGNTIVLHHDKQSATGPIVAIPDKHHDKPHTNPGQHPNGKRKGGGLTDDERLAFNKWKREFWMAKAKEALKKKGVCVK